ncbi:hypothetical protein D3C81_476490 [compost metagenome]
MISRTWIKCLACSGAITARIQIGHDNEQPISFPCPLCQTEVRLTLLLDEPPRVKIRWEENAELGTKEGEIINIGVGFTIPKDKLNLDQYFPSFDAPQPDFADFNLPQGHTGPVLLDTSIALGTLPNAPDEWRKVQRALRFHRTNQIANRENQLDNFWGIPRGANENLDNAIFSFLMKFMGKSSLSWLEPLMGAASDAHANDNAEFSRFMNDYDATLKQERFDNYSEILSEYFKSYNEFNQTLVYLRRGIPLPADAVATSSDFARTRMFYGNAFEVLGSHLDVPAAMNNMLSGRNYEQMLAMDLSQYRTINKANRTKCFSGNATISWLVAEYDSTIRNASHHRWFKIDAAHTLITYRSGGTGALQTMSYAEYLHRCNRLAIQIMVLACWELALLTMAGKTL